MNSVTPVLSCANISKTFSDGKLSVPVLESVDFSISSGEMVAIVGASGTGKSTLLQILGGLDTPSSGEVFWRGQSIAALKENHVAQLRNEILGFVYQFHHLLPEFDVVENVSMPLWIRGVAADNSRKEAELVLDQVGLAHRLTHRVGELSGGERQRVAIARALVGKPACVLADEPTGNLDHKTAGQIVDLMLSLNKQLETSFIVVTHNQELAGKLDRCHCVEDGQLHTL